MFNKSFVFFSVGFLFVITAVWLSGIGAVTTARSLTIGEKYTKFRSGNVTEEEQTGSYSFDKAHSSINFKIRHMGLVDVPGHFRDFDGTVSLAGKKFQDSTVEFSAKMKSVDTGINARDNHLRSKDFFEVDTFPEMTFRSKEIRKKGKTYRVKGDLTMKGVTKEITIPMRMFGPIKTGEGSDKQEMRMGVTGEVVINRRDFNVTYGGNLPDGTPTLSNTVTVDLQIEAFRKLSEK